MKSSNIYIFSAFVFWVFGFSTIYANTTECNQFYFIKPQISQNEVSSNDVIVLCNEHFVTVYDTKRKTALYSANTLTNEIVNSAKEIGRKNTFHEDYRLVPSARTKISDYKQSGYDRGHLVPSDDAPSYKSQYETFSLSNMVPQDKHSNRGIWKQLENTAREYTETEPKVYVISGPIYDTNKTTIGNEVLVPTRMFKIIFLPVQNKHLVYIIDNNNSKDVNVTTLDALETVTALDFD